jgi:hypothetical protein
MSNVDFSVVSIFERLCSEVGSLTVEALLLLLFRSTRLVIAQMFLVKTLCFNLLSKYSNITLNM